MLRALLVDDEQLARERLRRLLTAFDDLEVVGEAEDGEQAVEQILELKPNLVFLDIQMPGCSGMEVAASIPSPRPRIVFCTAFEEYAVDAFELHAIDYLLKPVNRTRLARAIDRARNLPETIDDASLDELSKTAEVYPARFLAKHGTRYRVVPARDVVTFASEGGLTQLRTADQRYWMQPSLTELEKRLDPSGFCRVSRSAIVNLDAVREVKPLPEGCGEATLSNGERVEVSRRRFKTLMDRLAV